MIYRGELLYGEPARFGVWEQASTGRRLHSFDDEYLAMQCAVKMGTTVCKLED